MLRAGKSVLADRTRERHRLPHPGRAGLPPQRPLDRPGRRADRGGGRGDRQPRPHPDRRRLLVVLLSAAGAWVLGSAALRAVDRMRGSVEAITAADMTARVKVPPGRDELAALGSTFNALLDRLAFAHARQRRFVADAGHELRGPLAVLRMELELADRPSRRRDELALAVRAAADEVDRLARLADDLLFLARSDDGDLQVRRESVLLEPLLRQATSTRSRSAAEQGVTLEVVAPPGLRIDVDPDRLRHALDNLVANALRVTPSGGCVPDHRGAGRRPDDDHRRRHRAGLLGGVPAARLRAVQPARPGAQRRLGRQRARARHRAGRGRGARRDGDRRTTGRAAAPRS